jgi:hypothetical protein
LSILEGDDGHAKVLLETYLADYRKILTNPVFKAVNVGYTEDKLESLATSAREKLAVIAAAVPRQPIQR